MTHNHVDPKKVGNKSDGTHPGITVRAKSMSRPLLLVGLLLAAAGGVAVVYTIGRPLGEESESTVAPAQETATPPKPTSDRLASQSAESQVATPQVATPQVATPQVATPQVATSQVATSQSGASRSDASVVPTNISRQLQAYLEPFVADVEAAPDDSQKQAALGLVYAGNRMWGEARACFQRASALDPANYLLTFYEGISCSKTGEMDRAIELFYTTIELNGEFAPAHHRLGNALLETGAVEEAESAFRETLAVSPMAAPAFMGLADVMLSLGDYSEAMTNADTALALRPGDPTAHYLLGLAFRGQGRPDLAKRHLQLGAQNTKPYLADPWTRTLSAHCKILDDQAASAVARLQAGEVDRAVSELEALLEWYPDLISLRNTLASAYRFAGKDGKSFALLQESITIDPTSQETYTELATHHLEQGQFIEALQAADKALEINPMAYQAHEVRGRIVYKLGRDNEAIAAWERAIEINPASPRTLLRAGLLSKSMGRLEAAQEFLERSIEQDSTSAIAYVALAEVHIRRGDLGAAAQLEQEARALFPNHEKVVLLTASLERAIENAGD